MMTPKYSNIDTRLINTDDAPPAEDEFPAPRSLDDMTDDEVNDLIAREVYVHDLSDLDTQMYVYPLLGSE